MRVPILCADIEKDYNHEDEDDISEAQYPTPNYEKTAKNVGAFVLMVDMVEARKRLGKCAGLKELPRNALHFAFDEIQLLCATLPNLEKSKFEYGVLGD